MHQIVFCGQFSYALIAFLPHMVLVFLIYCPILDSNKQKCNIFFPPQLCKPISFMGKIILPHVPDSLQDCSLPKGCCSCLLIWSIIDYDSWAVIFCDKPISLICCVLLCNCRKKSAELRHRNLLVSMQSALLIVLWCAWLARKDVKGGKNLSQAWLRLSSIINQL